MSEAGTGRAIRRSDRKGSSPGIQRVRSPKEWFSPAFELFRGRPACVLSELPFPSGLHTTSRYIDANLDFLEGLVSISRLTRCGVGGNILMFHVKHGHPTVEFNSLLWSSVNAPPSPWISRETETQAGLDSGCPIRPRSTWYMER